MPPLIYPQLATQFTLQTVLNQNLSLRLYANNRTPQVADTPAMYTEVVGGGYAPITLTYGNWAITAGSPSIALYNAFQDFAFTGVPDGSGVVYGYYILTAGWAPQFTTVVVGDTANSTDQHRPELDRPGVPDLELDVGRAGAIG